jgi:hypothetical protein
MVSCPFDEGFDEFFFGWWRTADPDDLDVHFT